MPISGVRTTCKSTPSFTKSRKHGAKPKETKSKQKRKVNFGVLGAMVGRPIVAEWPWLREELKRRHFVDPDATKRKVIVRGERWIDADTGEPIPELEPGPEAKKRGGEWYGKMHDSLDDLSPMLRQVAAVADACRYQGKMFTVDILMKMIGNAASMGMRITRSPRGRRGS